MTLLNQLPACTCIHAVEPLIKDTSLQGAQFDTLKKGQVHQKDKFAGSNGVLLYKGISLYNHVDCR